MSVLTETLFTVLIIFLLLYARSVDLNQHKEWQMCTLKTVISCCIALAVITIKAVVQWTM